LHRTKEDIPKDGMTMDASAPVARIVDEILRQIGASNQRIPKAGGINGGRPAQSPARRRGTALPG
jgi:hypothetical protein